MENGKNGLKRTLVIPGELLSDGNLKAGKNTYKRNDMIYASQMGFKSITANYVNVIPLNGRYIPKPDDLVIGIISSVSPSTWLVDINSPYPAPLHITEVPWRVDFGDTSRYLNTGDTILSRVFIVDEIKRVQVTMKDTGSRKLTGGQIIEISPTKVPRVIGKGGSMISLIKQQTMCRLFVGQNGRIWIDGDPDKIRLAVNAIRFIERESHRYGLTEAVERYLTKKRSGSDTSHNGPDIAKPPVEAKEQDLRRPEAAVSSDKPPSPPFPPHSGIAKPIEPGYKERKQDSPEPEMESNELQMVDLIPSDDKSDDEFGDFMKKKEEVEESFKDILESGEKIRPHAQKKEARTSDMVLKDEEFERMSD